MFPYIFSSSTFPGRLGRHLEGGWSWLGAMVMAMFLVPMAAHGALLPPRGEPRPYTPQDHGQHQRDQKLYVESWVYRIDLDSGHHLSVSVAVTNLGVVRGTCGLEVILLKDGTPVRIWNRGYGLEQFKATADRVSIGEDVVFAGTPGHGEHTLFVVNNKKGGLKLDLRFHDLVPGVIDGDFTWRFGEREGGELGSATMFPRARVSGTMEIAGRKFKAQGFAMGEHQLLTTLPTQSTRGYSAVRMHADGYSIHAWRFESMPRYGGGSGGLMIVADAKKVLWVTRDFSLVEEQVENRGGHKVPKRLVLKAKGADGRALSGVFSASAALHTYSVTEQLDPVVAKLAQVLVGNPIVFRDAAKGAVALTLPGGRKVGFQGVATHEIGRMNP